MRRLLVRPNRLLLLFLFPLFRLQFKMCRLMNLYNALSRVPIDPTMTYTYMRILHGQDFIFIHAENIVFFNRNNPNRTIFILAVEIKNNNSKSVVFGLRPYT